MNVNEAMRVLLVSTIERELDLIEAYKKSAEKYFNRFEFEEGRTLGLRAVSIIEEYISGWDENRFIPTFDQILNKLKDEHTCIEVWRKERAAMEEASKGEVNPCN